MAIYKTTKLIIKGETVLVTPTIITLRTSYITTEEDNEQTVNHLITPLFECAFDTRMNYLPRVNHNPHRYTAKKYLNNIYGTMVKYSDGKFKIHKRTFKLKPYYSMLFKDIPFDLHRKEVSTL